MDQPPKRFLIWGAGGHGKVVADLIRAAGHEVTGFIDRDLLDSDDDLKPGRTSLILREHDFLGGIRQTGRLPADCDAVALGMGDNSSRLQCLGRLSGLAAPPLVHPGAIVSDTVMVGRGSVILPAAVINIDARIGEGVIINSGAIVEHDCIVSSGAHVSPGATLAGRVVLGERSWVGAGATVIQGISIGADVVVGAGAVVIRDVPNGATVVGVPAKPIKRRS